ncbi:hypothetical protein V8E54_002245 [Elaphomyces granulatus]
MTRPNKRKQLARGMVKERECARSGNYRRPRRAWMGIFRITTIGLIQGGVELEDEVLVNEAEELEQVNESAFARLMASSIDESRPDLFKTPPGKAQEAAEGQRKDNGELPGHTKFLSEKGKVQRFYNWSARGSRRWRGGILAPIADLEEKLRSKAPDLTGQNSTRHQAVLRFPYCQKTRQKTDTRQSLALQVARCFNRERWFAYELGALLEKDRMIPTGKQGCFQKLKPWLTGEGVELAVRKG